MFTLSVHNVAKAAYAVDRAIAGTGVHWDSLDLATRTVWRLKVTRWRDSNGVTFPGSGGSEASLGSATRNSAFVAVMQALAPQKFPGHVAGNVSSFAVDDNTVDLSLAGTNTHQIVLSAEVDSNGDAVATGQYTYASDNEAKATVSGSGLITGVATGTANVTVTEHNGATQVIVVTVAA